MLPILLGSPFSRIFFFGAPGGSGNCGSVAGVPRLAASVAAFSEAAPVTSATKICCMLTEEPVAASDGGGSGVIKHFLTRCSNMLAESSSESESTLT